MQKGLEPYDLFVMQLILQNASEDMVESLIMYLNEECLSRLMALDLLSYVKAKRKSDHDFARLRLSPKGKNIYRDANKADYTEEDSALYDALVKIYDSVEKPVGNDIRVKELLAWFRIEGGYSRRQIFKAIKFFISVNEDDHNGKYIPTLENLIWKPNSVFSTKWNLADSKLYQFINENKAALNGNTASTKAS